MKYVLTIAGSDTIGGAGIQADIKTITALGAHALTVITAITAQNSLAIKGVYPVPGEFIRAQLTAIFEDITPDSVKIGMLGTTEALEVIAEVINRYDVGPIVLDPILKSSSGANLFYSNGLTLMCSRLLPQVGVITPNIHEAANLAQMEVQSVDDMKKAAVKIKAMGPDVVITGGHLREECVDLYYDGKDIYFFKEKKLEAFNTHGTGCVFSSSLATFLAFGKEMLEAIKMAKEVTKCAIINSYRCGRGPGPVNPASWEK